MAGDARFQRYAFPVSHRIAVEHAVRGGDGRLRRAGGWLAEFHVDDIPPRRREVMGDAAERDGMERIDVRDGGGVHA